MMNVEKLISGVRIIGKEYITLVELSKMLKISRATIDRWRKEGMPSIKIGKGVRFVEEDVYAWIVKNKSTEKNKAEDK